MALMNAIFNLCLRLPDQIDSVFISEYFCSNCQCITLGLRIEISKTCLLPASCLNGLWGHDSAKQSNTRSLIPLHLIMDRFNHQALWQVCFWITSHGSCDLNLLNSSVHAHAFVRPTGSLKPYYLKSGSHLRTSLLLLGAVLGTRST